MTCGSGCNSCGAASREGSGCSKCGYSSLSSYCSCSSSMAPVASQIPSQSTVVVPVFSAISYDTLSNGGCGCSEGGCGYFKIGSAYKTANCGAYAARSCGC